MLLSHPELQQVWANRATDPDTFNRARHALGKELHKLYSKLPDQEATETRAMMAHSMRGEGGQVEMREPFPNLGTFTDAELREFTRKNYGFV